jgi:hypothetical protein
VSRRNLDGPLFLCRAAQTALRWKGRKAGERALRYVLLAAPFWRTVKANEMPR